MTESTLQKHIEKLTKEVAERQKELSIVQKLLERFPDLTVETDRWHVVRFSAPSANSQVTLFETKHNCGCCADSPLEVWPYLLSDGVRVHSSPASITIGERKSYGFGDAPYPGWQGRLLKLGIPNELVERIEHVFPEESEESDDSE